MRSSTKWVTLFLITTTLTACLDNTPTIEHVTVQEVVSDVCGELAPVDIERVASHVNLDTIRHDLEAIQDMRDIEDNEARRVACLRGAAE